MESIKEANVVKLYAVSIITLLILLVSTITFTIVYFEYDEFNEALKIKKENFLISQKEQLISETQRIKDYIKFERDRSEDVLKSMIKEEVYKLDSTIKSIYEFNKNSLSPEDLKKMIIESVRDIRFYDNRGYFFIDDIDGNALLLPIQPEYEGKTMLNNIDLNGKYIMRSFIQIVKDTKEGFHTYSWYAPNDTTKHHTKIAFVKLFEPYNWIIGTGEYLDSIENDIEEKILERIRNIRFGKEGYFTIFNSNGDILVLPSRKNLEGLNYKDYQGQETTILNEIIPKAIELALNGGGFNQYKWYKLRGNDIESKLSYITKIEGTDWILNSGIYLDDLEKELLEMTKLEQENILKEVYHIVFISVIALIIAIVISLFFANLIGNIFNRYKRKIEEANRDLEDRVKLEITKRRDNERILIQQSKLAEMGDMIGAIAHQWRQPLNVLALHIQDIEDAYEFNELNKDYISDFIDKTMGQINYMSKTIDDFRNFFKPNKEKHIFSIKNAIENAKSLIEAQFRNKNISIDINGDDQMINGYQNEFSQVVLNLLNNSKDSILSRRQRDSNYLGNINISIDEVGDFAEVSICDNGTGIRADVIDRVFEPYFTTKDKNKGTGIGLYMAKTIIETNMGGEIFIDRECLDGARIIIKILISK